MWETNSVKKTNKRPDPELQRRKKQDADELARLEVMSWCLNAASPMFYKCVSCRPGTAAPIRNTCLLTHDSQGKTNRNDRREGA